MALKEKFKFQVAKSNFTLIIFGASGSLAKLKLFPALYELYLEKRMPADFKIVGYSRTKMSQQEFKNYFTNSIKHKYKDYDQNTLKSFLQNVFYFSGDYSKEDDYLNFKNYLQEIEESKNRVRMAYFSVPPSAFLDIFKNLGTQSFDTNFKLRLVIEKPFGYNYESAKKLKQSLLKYFDEDQIFLLDHYLGKEAVTNLLSLRYANSILTNLLRNEYVSNIQINALESKDIEGRANYFDHVGTLRDMVQSHLFQILAFLTMYLPMHKTYESLKHEKITLIKSLKIKDLENSIIRGQYKGYQKEKGVKKSSTTETFVALKLFVKNKLWKNTPVYLRTGKSLSTQWTSIVIEFRPRRTQRETPNLPTNKIVIQLQPFEKIEFFLLTKLGGKAFDFHEITTGRPIYCSGDCLSEHGRLLLDVIANKQELFLHFDEIFAAWKLVDPLQNLCDRMRKQHCKPYLYDKKSLGPKSADSLLKNDGFKWFNSLPK